MATEKEKLKASTDLNEAWNIYDFSESGLSEDELTNLYVALDAKAQEKPKKNYAQFIAAHLKMAVEAKAASADDDPAMPPDPAMVPQGSHPDRPPLPPASGPVTPPPPGAKPTTSVPVCYTFRAKSECTKVVKKSEYMNMADGHGGYKRVVTGDKTAIRIAFDVGGNFLLTESFAKMHDMTIDEMYKLIIAFGDYGIEFLCIAGPGINPSEEDLKRFSERTPDMIKTVQGPR